MKRVGPAKTSPVANGLPKIAGRPAVNAARLTVQRQRPSASCPRFVRMNCRMPHSGTCAVSLASASLREVTAARSSAFIAANSTRTRSP